MAVSSVSPHYQCLDVFNLNWHPVAESCRDESVVMLEVWEGGATLHTGSPVPAGASVFLVVDGGKIPGHVVECCKDHEFGFVVTVDVDAPEQWFPAGHMPAWRLENDLRAMPATDFAHCA